MNYIFNLVTEIGRLILLAMVILSVVIMIKGSTLVLYDVTEFEQYIDMYKMMHDKNGITFYDGELDQVFSNIVDLEKFNEKRLNKLMNFPDARSMPSAQLVLYNNKGNPVKTTYWHHIWYNNNYAKATEKRGRGGIRKHINQLPVHYMNNNQLHEGSITVTFIIPET